MKTPTPLVTHVGATVAYTAAFLRSCGMVTGPWGAMRGKVVELVGDRFARVLWEGEAESRLVALANLAHPGPNARFANVD